MATKTIEAAELPMFAKYSGIRPLNETSIDDIPLAEQSAYWRSLGQAESEEYTDEEADQLYAAWVEAQQSYVLAGEWQIYAAGVVAIMARHKELVREHQIGFYASLEALAEKVRSSRNWSHGETFVCSLADGRYVIMKQVAPASCEMLTVTQNGCHDVLTAYRFSQEELVQLLSEYVGTQKTTESATGTGTERTTDVDAKAADLKSMRDRVRKALSSVTMNPETLRERVAMSTRWQADNPPIGSFAGRIEESRGEVAVFQARDLWDAARQPAARHILLHLQAIIGRRWLEKEDPLDQMRGRTASLWGWISEDQLIRVAIDEHQRQVEIEVERRGQTAWARVEVPGEIVGLRRDESYRGLFFSTERGERHANLFDLLDVTAAAVVSALEMADMKLRKLGKLD